PQVDDGVAGLVDDLLAAELAQVSRRARLRGQARQVDGQAAPMAAGVDDARPLEGDRALLAGDGERRLVLRRERRRRERLVGSLDERLARGSAAAAGCERDR